MRRSRRSTVFLVHHVRPWAPKPWSYTHSRPQGVGGIVTSKYMYNWRDPNVWKTVRWKLERPWGVTSDWDSCRNDRSRPLWQILPQPPWTHGEIIHNICQSWPTSWSVLSRTVYLARAPRYSNAAATNKSSQRRTCGSSSVGIKILIIWLQYHDGAVGFWLAFVNMN